MGLLTYGKPLSWKNAEGVADEVHRKALRQFLHIYHKHKDMQGDGQIWGEEVEYSLVKLDGIAKTAHASIKSSQVLKELTDKQTLGLERSQLGHWMPETAEYQIESIPYEPYTGHLEDLVCVQESMKQRRRLLQSVLPKDEHPVTITTLPRCGCEDFTDPSSKADPHSGIGSMFFSAEAICQGHPRYRTLITNTPERAGHSYAINIPVFLDKNTSSPWVDGVHLDKGLPDHIYMDSQAFSTTNNNLHVTLQAYHLEDAKNLYDQFVPLAPILLALTAGAPAFRGFLTEVDAKWAVSAQGDDDRTKQERQPQMCEDGGYRYMYERRSSPSCYLSRTSVKYNDGRPVFNEAFYDNLVNEGVDEQMAMHAAVIFTRDPLVVYEDRSNLDDIESTIAFDTVHTLIWSTVRFKLPYPDGSVGWRVEVRPMEGQITDFENTAFAIFVVLLSKVIREFKLDFLIPISQVHENMKRAVVRDAARESKFHFRAEIACQKTFHEGEMTTKEIINGIPGRFEGLLAMINRYLDRHVTDPSTRARLDQYLMVVSKTASGQRPTPARWIRDFVTNHPEYKQDSVISEQINYDLLSSCVEMEGYFYS